MTKLEELLEMEKRLDDELVAFKERHQFMKDVVRAKKNEAWVKMFDDCLALAKYKCILDTGIIAVNKATYGFRISNDGTLMYERFYMSNGKFDSSYIMSISRDKPYQRCNNGWCSTDSIYLDDLKRDVIDHWDIAYQNIQKNVAKQMEMRMNKKLKDEVRREISLEDELAGYGIRIL